MAIPDLYSHRKNKKDQSRQSDVYQYDSISDHLITQIIMILDEVFGNTDQYWKYIINRIARAYRDPSVNKCPTGRQSCVNFLTKRGNIDNKLDIIELACKVIDKDIRKFAVVGGIIMTSDEAIPEINYRLREGGVGYQYENGIIIRMDSQFVHEEITKNALSLLSSKEFSGAEDEFLSAHKHYRHGEHKDAIVDAGASFESTMKCICDTLMWKYEKGARASDLIKVLREHRLFANYLDNSFDQLLAILKSGLPEIRNNEGSHGQGSVPKRVPAHVAAYAIHLAATNIVFLVECMKDLQGQTPR